MARARDATMPLLSDFETVKYEEVYLHTYKSVAKARAGIGRYLTFAIPEIHIHRLVAIILDMAYFKALETIIMTA